MGRNADLEQSYYNFNAENEYEDIGGMVSLSGSIDSVRSELNPRVIFQRNGRGRASGHSIKSAQRKQRFTEQQQKKDERYEKEQQKNIEKLNELKITKQQEKKHQNISQTEKKDPLLTEAIVDLSEELLIAPPLPVKPSNQPSKLTELPNIVWDSQTTNSFDKVCIFKLFKNEIC